MKEKDPKKERAKLIEHMLSAVEAEFDDRGKSNEFIESIRVQFDNQGWLTDNQLKALHKFYENTA